MLSSSKISQTKILLRAQSHIFCWWRRKWVDRESSCCPDIKADLLVFKWMMVSDTDVNSAALLLQTENADDTGRLCSNVLPGDWTTERVSTVRLGRCCHLSKARPAGHSGLAWGHWRLRTGPLEVSVCVFKSGERYWPVRVGVRALKTEKGL